MKEVTFLEDAKVDTKELPKPITHEVVIVGAGLAGLRAALELSKSVDVAVLSKQHPLRSQSVMAQGGVNASFSKNDSWKKHFEDTVTSGVYLADQDAVEILAKESPQAVKELDYLGALFTRSSNGSFRQRKLGAQSVPRTCHASDRTGHTLMRTLYEQCVANNVKFYTNRIGLSLSILQDSCSGIIAFNTISGEVEPFQAKAVLLATGGYAQMFKTTASAYSSTGDGHAMILKAGYSLQDMEFIQFHPTGLYPSGILISEATRGEGGYLLNGKGERFLKKVDKNKIELAPRDVIARAIRAEIDSGRGAGKNKDHVLLDLTHLGNDLIAQRLPQVKEMASRLAGIDCTKKPLPVVPTAHYSMGGIPINVDCEVLTGKDDQKCAGLYAVGECSCISVHGANRVGGNSLAECLVFGKRAAKSISDYVKKRGSADIPEADIENELIELDALRKCEGSNNIKDVSEEFKTLMHNSCGIIRSYKHFKIALKKIAELKLKVDEIVINDNDLKMNTAFIELIQLKNLIKVAEVVIESASSREESRGAHYREDHKRTNNKKWLKHTLASLSPLGVNIEHKPVRIENMKP